jgi:Carbonic anhydrase
MDGATRIGRLIQGIAEDPRSSRSDGHPRRAVAVLTCMDPRLDPERILGLDPGDAHVIRNAGGVITDDVVQSIGISQRELGTRAIIVLHHTGCSGVKARRPGVRAEVALHDAVEALRHDVRLVHHQWVSGALYDTVGQVLLEGGRPRGLDDHSHAPAPARRAGSPYRTYAPAAALSRRCAWCGRPFGGVGSGRRDARRRYCGDLCRIAARRGARQPH